MPIRYLLLPDAAANTYTLACDSGTFALTGTTATPRFNRAVTAATGSFTLSGTAATPKFNRAITAASGTFALTGTAANFVYGVTYSLSAASGSFALTGTAATFSRPSRVMALDSGSIVLSGTAADLIYAQGQRTLSANSGAFALIGTSSAGTFLRQIDIDYLLWYMQENLMIPTAEQNAAAVRTELTTELGRIDAAVSTRLATAGYTAPDNVSVTAIKAVTDEIIITNGLVHGDVKKQNAATVYGNGTSGNKWRGTP